MISFPCQQLDVSIFRTCLKTQLLVGTGRQPFLLPLCLSRSKTTMLNFYSNYLGGVWQRNNARQSILKPTFSIQECVLQIPWNNAVTEVAWFWTVLNCYNFYQSKVRIKGHLFASSEDLIQYTLRDNTTVYLGFEKQILYNGESTWATSGSAKASMDLN